jgi:isocitrate lyase
VIIREKSRHQREVGTGYFDLVRETITRGTASASAMASSTEEAQFDQEAVG